MQGIETDVTVDTVRKGRVGVNWESRIRHIYHTVQNRQLVGSCCITQQAKLRVL